MSFEGVWLDEDARFAVRASAEMRAVERLRTSAMDEISAVVVNIGRDGAS